MMKRVWNAYVEPRHLVAPSHEDVTAEVQGFIRPMVQRCLEPAADAGWNPLNRAWDETVVDPGTGQIT